MGYTRALEAALDGCTSINKGVKIRVVGINKSLDTLTGGNMARLKAVVPKR